MVGGSNFEHGMQWQRYNLAFLNANAEPLFVYACLAGVEVLVFFSPDCLSP